MIKKIQPQHPFHCNHNNKVTGIGFIAAYFDRTLDNGCVVEKCYLYRHNEEEKLAENLESYTY